MKSNIRLFMSIMAACLFVGCSTPNRTAYVSIGALAVSVNTSVKAYNEFYQAGKSNDIEREKVKAAYQKYQAAARVARQVQSSVSAQPDSVASYQVITDAVSASAKELISLIEQFQKAK